MRLDKLTVKSQESLQEAQETARRLGHAEIAPLHLLDALIRQEGGLVPIVLNQIGVDVTRLRRKTQSRLESLPSVRGGADPHVGDDLRHVLEAAEKQAGRFRDDFISVEHLLLGLVERRSPAADLLRDILGVGARAGHLPGDAVDAVVMLADQLLERSAVARDRGGYEGAVRIVPRHLLGQPAGTSR